MLEAIVYEKSQVTCFSVPKTILFDTHAPDVPDHMWVGGIVG